jgi:uncharacterized protein with PQ loop repeat
MSKGTPALKLSTHLCYHQCASYAAWVTHTVLQSSITAHKHSSVPRCADLPLILSNCIKLALKLALKLARKLALKLTLCTGASYS